jgi:hypothetical protein
MEDAAKRELAMGTSKRRHHFKQQQGSVGCSCPQRHRLPTIILFKILTLMLQLQNAKELSINVWQGHGKISEKGAISPKRVGVAFLQLGFFRT